MKSSRNRKINKVRLLGVLSLATVVLFYASGSLATIVGTAHDFSSGTNPHAVGQICEACHVPHNAKSTQVPLWRGTLSFFNPTYSVYSSNTLDATVNQPTGPTKACLSCHDNTIGRGPLQGSCFDCHATPLSVGGSGLNLEQHHPVSFRYDTALARQDGQLHVPNYDRF